MAQQNSSEEVDLGYLWIKVKEIKNRILLLFYKTIRFVIKNWLILLALVITGILIGYFLEKYQKIAREGSLIVQINFDASNYVYNSIEHLNNKVIDKDTIFLKKMGFYKDQKIILRKVEIVPIVNIADILDKINVENRSIEPLLDQAQYEDNLLTSEIFIPEYKTHRISIKTTEEGSSATINYLLAYLNDNELMQQIKEVTVLNTIDQIKQIKQSIVGVDSIVKKYGTQIRGVSTSQVYFNSVEANNNMHLLFSLKNTLLKNVEKLEIELLKYNDIVTLLDNPFLATKKSFFDKKMIILPILFVLLFIIFLFFKKAYKKAQRIEEASYKYL